jgi:drug/metabolite transporter (DMT)-like permease
MLVYYGLLFSVITVLAYGIGNAVTKKCDVEYGKYKTAIISIAAGILPNLVIYIFFPSAFTLPLVLIGIGTGFLFALGYVLFFKSLETEQASNTYSLTLIQAVAISAFGIVVLSEPLSPLAIGGAMLGITGVILVSTTRGFKINRYLIPAMLGNIVWSVGWFVVDYMVANGANFIVLLTLQRTIAALIVLIPFVLYWKTAEKRHASGHKARNVALAFGIGGGLLSGIGNLAFAYLADLNFVAVGSILTAFVPIITILIAIPLYGDKMTRLQWFGIAVATVGAIAIAA